MAVFNHTDLGRGGDFPERFRRIAELADAVVIDEAHHFRNPGRRGDPERGSAASPPTYNAADPELELGDRDEIRILISTDVLSEGLNLQDASRMINYDIHWNPVRLMQRIGRVDRRMNPEIERRFRAERPEVAASRGTVRFWNFLPPNELNKLLTLYRRVTRKTLLISRTLGIEGRKLLTPEDDYEALKEFNHSYEGTRTSVEELHLEYQALLKVDPGLEARLSSFPGQILSGRRCPAKGARGVFFCYALPALDKEKGEFTEEAGTTRWYYFVLDDDTILDDPGEIVAGIRSTPRDAAPVRHGGENPSGHPKARRTPRQEQLPEAGGRARGGRGPAGVLDGVGVMVGVGVSRRNQSPINCRRRVKYRSYLAARLRSASSNRLLNPTALSEPLS